MKDDIKKKIKFADKILKQLVFNKFNIPYDIKPEWSAFKNKWTFDIWIDIDVDRYTDFSPNFEQEYQNYIDTLYNRIKNSLMYVNLQNDFGELFFDYINDDETEDVITQLTQELYNALENKYNVRYNEIENSDIYYYLYKSDMESPYFRVELLGNPIIIEDEDTGEEQELVTCQELEEMMITNYKNKNIGLDYENFICN